MDPFWVAKSGPNVYSSKKGGHEYEICRKFNILVNLANATYIKIRKITLRGYCKEFVQQGDKIRKQSNSKTNE